MTGAPLIDVTTGAASDEGKAMVAGEPPTVMTPSLGAAGAGTGAPGAGAGAG